MSRGGGKKGAEAGRGRAEKRGESIVILNRKYSGIKQKKRGLMYQKWDIKRGRKESIKKAPVANKRLNKYSYCQWSNISIMGSEIFKRCDRLRTISSYGISLESYPRSV